MFRILGTAIITLLITGLLLWDHFHGGVPSHHILNRRDLPAISNWWGILLLPVLAWILLGRIFKRMRDKSQTTEQIRSGRRNIVLLFIIGLSIGIILATSFMLDFKPFLDNVPYVFLVLALLLPLYYSEFILGFVLGMTYTFGVLLPTVFILIIAAVGFVLYRILRPLVLQLFNSRK